MQRSHASVVASVTHSDPPGELATLNESPTIAPPEPSANIEKCVNPPAMTTEGPTLAVDELVVPAEAVERPTPGRERARTGRWLAVLAAGFVLQVAWRLYLYLPLVGPTAHADEDGYLFAARVTGGGPNAMLPAWSIMRAIGYPLILSPIHWFVQDPTAVYRGVHIVNAIVGALIFPLVYLLGRRMFDFGRWPAAGIAFVLATLPSAVRHGNSWAKSWNTMPRSVP